MPRIAKIKYKILVKRQSGWEHKNKSDLLWKKEEFFKIQPIDKQTEEQYQAALWFRKLFNIPESKGWAEAKEEILVRLNAINMREMP